MKKFLLMLALFCLVGGNIAVVDCSESGGEESEEEIEEGEENVEEEGEEGEEGDVENEESEKEGGEEEAIEDLIENEISIFFNKNFKKETWDKNISTILTTIFEYYKKEKNITKTVGYILPLCDVGTSRNPVDLYKKVVTPAWQLLQEKDPIFYTNKTQKDFLDLLYKTAIDEHSNIIVDALDLFAFFKTNNPKKANAILEKNLKSYNSPKIFFKTIQRICPHEEDFLKFIENLECLYPAWLEFFPKKYFCNASNNDVKSLQNAWIIKPPSIIQLRSLDQMHKDVNELFGLKCGLYATYNLIFMTNIIENKKNFEETFKNYTDLKNGVILGSDNIKDDATLHKTFKIWVDEQEEMLLTNSPKTYTKATDVPSIVKQKKDIEEDSDKLSPEKKQIKIENDNFISKEDKKKHLLRIKENIKNKKLTSLTIQDLDDLEKFINKYNDIKKKYDFVELTGGELENILIKNVAPQILEKFAILDAEDLNKLTSKEDIEKLLITESKSFIVNDKSWNYVPLHEKIRQFRNFGTSIYLILLKTEHWFCAAMTTKGMYIANSFGNTPYTKYPPLQKLYDYILFGNIPEETKSDVKPSVKKDPLENALALLKAKLLSLAKQLTTKN